MKSLVLIKTILCSAIIFSATIYAGVYQGATDDATFEQLLAQVTAKSDLLDQKVAEAKSKGINTDYAQVSQVTIQLFKDIFAPWDKANIDQVKAMYDAVYFSQFDPVGYQGLPFDELADCLEVADTAIAELEQQISGEIVLQSPPNFDQGQLVLNGPNYELDGNKVIAGKFFWQPNNKDVMKAYGYGGEAYYSVQDLSTSDSIKNWRQTNFINRINDQLLNNRSPIQFFLGHIAPANYWLREDFPLAFDKGGRLFTDYDIDNPEVKQWMTTLFNKQLSVGVSALGDTERVHMIANEPTFSIREGGVNAANGVSTYTLANYTAWLEKKYQTIAQLNSAYASNFSSFDQVKERYTIPLALSYQGSAVWYDWNIFNMERVNQWFSFLHNSIHEVDPKAKTHIKIMGERAIHTPYQDEGLDFEFIAKLVDMPGSDNQTNPFATQWDLRHKQNWRERYSIEWLAQSIMLDFNKSLAPQKHFYDSEWHGLSGARWRDFHMSPDYVRTSLWLAATHGLGSLTSWVWNRKEDGSIDTRADFIGTSVTQPIQLDAYGRALKELNAHGNKVSALVPTERAYLLYYSKDAAIQDPTYTQSLSEVYEALKLQNVAVGFTTPSELANVDKNKQTLIISPTKFISDHDLENLSAFNDAGGYVVLFDQAQNFVKTEIGGSRNNNTPFSPMASLAFNDITTMADELKQALVSRKPVLPIALAVTDQRNQSAYGVMTSQYIDEHNGRAVLSLINVSQSNKVIELSSAKGIPNDVVNLITGQAASAKITLEPLAVLLLSIDTETVESNSDEDNVVTPPINTEPKEEAKSSGGVFSSTIIMLLLLFILIYRLFLSRHSHFSIRTMLLQKTGEAHV